MHCLEKNGQKYASKPDMARLLSEQYESVFIDDDGTIPKMLNRCDTDISTLIVTRSNIVEAIRTLKTDSSPGVDKITPWFYKSFPSQLATPLQMILIGRFRQGRFLKNG